MHGTSRKNGKPFPPPPPGERKYPLLSEAIDGGLYHPNCKDTHSTYFEGLDDEPEKPTQKDAGKAADAYNAEQKKRYAQRQARKYERLEAGSVDGENVAKYEAKEEEWSSTARKLFTINDGDGIINTKRVVSTKLASSGKVANPMDESDYYRIKASLNKRGIEVFAATGGDDLRYMLYIGAEGTYSNGRITHIGEIPSRGTFFEEIIHMRQSEVYGELLSTDTVELCAREIEANRKLLKYKKEYKLDSLDIKDIERNILAWEQSFQRITGVSYDESNYWRKI